MKKLFLLVWLMPTLAFSCNGYLLGFKGKDDVFDNRAFREYATHLNYCYKTYSWHRVNDALKDLEDITVPYRLYGFSLGAVSVLNFLKKTNVRKPEYVITVGAYKTTDVNFDKFEVNYNNFFDRSGIGQKSPGKFLNVSHDKIQQEVNKFLIWGQ